LRLQLKTLCCDKVMIKVAEEPVDSGAVVETGDGREVETMEMKREGEEGRVEMGRKTKVVVDLMCDGSVKSVCRRLHAARAGRRAGGKCERQKVERQGGAEG